MAFILIKTLHIIFVLVLFACLVLEYKLIKNQLPRETIKQLAIIDGIYGLSSIFILVSGFYIALKLGKGFDFYFTHNTIYIKLTIFVVVGLLSIYPTIYFIKNRSGKLTDLIDVPLAIKRIITVELILILCIPFFAVMLANGISLL